MLRRNMAREEKEKAASNSVHPQHRGGWHDRFNHYVFCFHDETFECLAESFTTARYVEDRSMHTTRTLSLPSKRCK